MDRSAAGHHRPQEPAPAQAGVNPDPLLIATEGALWGSVKAHRLLPDTVIISDDAGHSNVGRHALCWVHADPRESWGWFTSSTPSRTSTAPPRPPSAPLIWQFYRDLKSYPCAPTAPRKAALAASSTASSRSRPASSPSTGSACPTIATDLALLSFFRPLSVR
jgi:hypothetical protein